VYSGQVSAVRLLGGLVSYVRHGILSPRGWPG
jgi:hypothetical protein